MALDDYMKQMQTASMQNALYENDKYRNMASGLGTMYRKHPFEGYDMNSMTISEIQDMITYLQKIYDNKTLHTPLWSPTRYQCNKHESLANAHNELMVIKTLVGI